MQKIINFLTKFLQIIIHADEIKYYLGFIEENYPPPIIPVRVGDVFEAVHNLELLGTSKFSKLPAGCSAEVVFINKHGRLFFECTKIDGRFSKNAPVGLMFTIDYQQLRVSFKNTSRSIQILQKYFKLFKPLLKPFDASNQTKNDFLIYEAYTAMLLKR